MPKRSRATHTVVCVLENIPLLRRLLLNEAALVQPGILCAVSRNVHKAVSAVMKDVGFWRELTIRCMPNMQELPNDAFYCLQNGRFGPPQSVEAENMAWYLNYKRIVKHFLHMRFLYNIGDGERTGVIQFVPYKKFYCNDINVLFQINEHVEHIFLFNSDNTFACDISLKRETLSRYRFTLQCNEGQNFNFDTTAVTLQVHRGSTYVKVNISTDVSKLTHTANHLLHMFSFELPENHDYADKKCTVYVSSMKNATTTLTQEVFECSCADRANAIITQYLREKVPGIYTLRGPRYAEYISFYWNGDEFSYFQGYLLGDLMDTHGEMRIMKTL